MNQQHRAVACPATSAALQLSTLAAVGVGVVAAAHNAGIARMQEAREQRAQGLWHARLINARRSSAEALAVARAAVYRVQELEAENAALRRSVASRSALIKSMAANG